MGYVFAGWNTAVDGSGTAYAANATVVVTPNMRLYAQWTIAAAPPSQGIEAIPTLSQTMLLLLGLLLAGLGMRTAGRKSRW